MCAYVRIWHKLTDLSGPKGLVASWNCVLACSFSSQNVLVLSPQTSFIDIYSIWTNFGIRKSTQIRKSLCNKPFCLAIHLVSTVKVDTVGPPFAFFTRRAAMRSIQPWNLGRFLSKDPDLSREELVELIEALKGQRDVPISVALSSGKMWEGICWHGLATLGWTLVTKTA